MGANSANPTGAEDSNIPEFVDRYSDPLPILYYRAKVGANAVVLTMDDPVQQLRMTRQLRQKYPDLPIISRARDADHAGALYQAGASDAVPETLESSLQLAEAVLIDLGVAMGPVIASIHDVRAKMRHDIMTKGKLEQEPRIRKLRTTIRPPQSDAT